VTSREEGVSAVIKDITILCALSQVAGITWKWLSSFSWETRELADYNFLVNHGLPPSVAMQASQAVDSYDSERTEEALHKLNAHTLSITDERYPELLRSIYDPPLVLFVRGMLPMDIPCVGVIGSRKATPYGRQAIEAIIPPLVAGGVTTISGLARGIDTLAHTVTVRHGGRTVAVLGSGIDTIYPNENRTLAETIITSGGAVISEYPPGAPPLRHHFPARNRIISGLSRAVIVVEGDRKSGSLITADYAMEQGRDVIAVPVMYGMVRF